MKVFASIKGAVALKQRMKQVSHETKLKWERACRAAARHVQEVSINLTPMDTGVLRSSCGMTRISAGWYAHFQIYYSAGYAIYVHEMVDNYHPIGEAEFLKKAVLRSETEVMNIMHNYMSN